MQLEPISHLPPGDDAYANFLAPEPGGPCSKCGKETLEIRLYDRTAEDHNREIPGLELALKHTDAFVKFVRDRREDSPEGPFVRLQLRVCTGCEAQSVIVRFFGPAILGLDLREVESERQEEEAPGGLAEALERALDPMLPGSLSPPPASSDPAARALADPRCPACDADRVSLPLFCRSEVRWDDAARSELRQACHSVDGLAALSGNEKAVGEVREPHVAVSLTYCPLCGDRSGGAVVIQHMVYGWLDYTENKPYREWIAIDAPVIGAVMRTWT